MDIEWVQILLQNREKIIEFSLPFSLPSFPFPPEAPDTQAKFIAIICCAKEARALIVVDIEWVQILLQNCEKTEEL